MKNLKNSEEKGIFVGGHRVSYELIDTSWGAMFKAGRKYIKIPATAMGENMFVTSRLEEEEYTVEKVIWVNKQFVVKVPPYSVEGTAIKTWAYGRMIRYSGEVIGCFEHTVLGDPCAMFLDLRGSVISSCGCRWDKSGDASLQLTYKL